jgi:hypothetical protein
MRPSCSLNVPIATGLTPVTWHPGGQGGWLTLLCRTANPHRMTKDDFIAAVSQGQGGGGETVLPERLSPSGLPPWLQTLL